MESTLEDRLMLLWKVVKNVLKEMFAGGFCSLVNETIEAL